MKVLFLMPRFHTNMGPFAQGLVSRGVQVKAFVVGAGTTESPPDGVEVQLLRPAAWQPLIRSSSRAADDFALFATKVIPSVKDLFRHLRAYSPDYVVCRGLTPAYILCALPYIVLFSKLVVYTQGPRDRTWSVRKWISNTLVLGICQGRWFTPVERRGRVRPPQWTDQRIHLIPFSMEPCPGADERTWDLEFPRLLAVGKLTPRKNHRLLIACLAKLPPEFRLTIIGECSNEDHKEHRAELLALCESLGVSDRCVVLTNVPHRAMTTHYFSHDLFMMISSNEPASVSQLEAMAHGLGVIVSQDNGTATYVVEDANGMHCEPTVPSILACLNVVSQRRELLAIWGRSSARLVTERHSPEVTTSRFLRMLQR